MIKIKVLTIAFAISLALPGFAASLASNADSDVAMQNAILHNINKYRTEHGRSPLQMNTIISIEAKKHSLNMARHAVSFGHQNFMDRIKNIYAQIKQCRGGAENVAYNYKNARIVVREWLKSPGHKKNIDGNYNQTGIGIARDKQGKIYYTQMFIRTDNRSYKSSREQRGIS